MVDREGVAECLEKKKTIRRGGPPWLTDVVVAISVLIVILAVVAFLYGKEAIERPFLAFFILLAWLGALVGLKVPSGTHRQ